MGFFLRMCCPCPASLGAKEAGHHPGTLEWPGQACTHPGQLLFSLDLCIDLLWACILPCPAFVASLSPCTRICRLAKWEESSFLDCQDPEDYVLLEVLSSEPAETSPLTTHHSNLYFPTFMCSKGQEAKCDHLIQQ